MSQKKLLKNKYVYTNSFTFNAVPLKLGYAGLEPIISNNIKISY